jgi:hypothetical protein
MAILGVELRGLKKLTARNRTPYTARQQPDFSNVDENLARLFRPCELNEEARAKMLNAAADNIALLHDSRLDSSCTEAQLNKVRTVCLTSRMINTSILNILECFYVEPSHY